MENIAYKFNPQSDCQLESLKNSLPYQVREKINKGEKLTRLEKNEITKRVNNNAFFKRSIPILGWKFDFSDILNCYVVKHYDHWSEIYATDKTAIRQTQYGLSKAKILQVY